MHIKCLVCTLSSPLMLMLTVVTFSTLYINVACIEIPTRFVHKRNVERDNSAENANEASEQVRGDGGSVNDVNLISFYKQMDNVSDISEFIERFVDKDTIDPQLGLQDSFRRSVERANVQRAVPAACMPENTVVPLTPLNPSHDPNVVYFPKCTRVKRCGGCCGSQLMSCQPTETETINFEVTKYKLGAKSISGREIVVVEQHTKCKCDCRIKAKDCNSYQIYRPEKCNCECTNEDALQKCLSQEHKYWDETACRCVCRDSQSCTTGTVFDESECACVDINQIQYIR